MHPNKGFFIVFEGSDGSGKSTMSIRLYNSLLQKFDDGDVIHARNPGATELGVKIRHIVKHEISIPIDPFTEQLLMVVDNSAFINGLLRPSLAKNKIVIADRSNFISGIAYGSANGLDDAHILKMLNIVDSPMMDMLMIFSCPYEIAKQRATAEGRHDAKDRFESRGENFLRRVIDVYDSIDKPGHLNPKGRFTNSIVKIDASKPMDDVYSQVESAVFGEMLKQKVI